MNPAQLLAHFDRISEAPDAVARLRRFVLDLAVRGKLVAQDPEDEPASELLRRIRAEKDRLTPSRQDAKKDKDDSLGALAAWREAPFAIPGNWEWEQLGAIATKTGSGSTPRGGQSVYQSTGIAFLRSQNVYNDGLRLNDVAYIDHVTHAKMSGTAIEPGDLLLNITGGSIGRCCRLADIAIEANISQHVAIIRLAVAEMRDYVHKVVLSPFFQSYVIDEQTGAGRGGLPKNRMDQIPVPVPPLAEQHRIVAKVDELMGLCDQLEAAKNERELVRDRLVAASLDGITPRRQDAKETEGSLGALASWREPLFLHHLPRLTTRPEHIKQLRQTLLNLAVRGRLVQQDPNDELAAELLKRIRGERDGLTPRRQDAKKGENKPLGALAPWREAPFAIPENWVWATVGEIAEYRLGKMLDKAKNKGTPRRYLRNVNVRWFDFDLSDVFEMRFEDSELEEFALRKGDVLICEGGEPGRAAVWDEREEGIYFQKAIHRVRFANGVNPHYFANVLRDAADTSRLATYFTGVGIKHFTGKGLASFLVPLPPLAEQHRIVAKVDELMALCDQLEAQLTATQIDSRRLLEAVLRDALDATPALAV